MAVRVLAFTFAAGGAAHAARDTLVATFDMADGDAKVAPSTEAEAVLGVRVPPESVPTLTQVVEGYGGHPVLDIDEAWTKPRQ